MHGLVHPEMGHQRLPHDRARDPFPGVCPHHGDCWEGLASAPALAARWGQPPETLPDVHPAWDLEADYLALGLANVVLVLSPERDRARRRRHDAREPLADGTGEARRPCSGATSSSPALGEGIARYLVSPALGERAGVLGALLLAQAAVAARSDIVGAARTSGAWAPW